MQRVSPYSWMTQFNKYLVFDGEGPLGSVAECEKDKGGGKPLRAVVNCVYRVAK